MFIETFRVILNSFFEEQKKSFFVDYHEKRLNETLSFKYVLAATNFTFLILYTLPFTLYINYLSYLQQCDLVLKTVKLVLKLHL